MSRPASIVVLCEDPQQACFVRRFLMNRGWRRYDIREEIHPKARGSGEQGVREKFPDELKAYRSKCNHLKNGLIAVIDADTRDVARRTRQVDTACDRQEVDRRRPDERVLLVIPKRNIETWLAYLRGEDVDENAPRPYPRYDCESRCRPDVDRLDVMCREGRLEGHPPPSLERCCTDFQTFWDLIR